MPRSPRLPVAKLLELRGMVASGLSVREVSKQTGASRTVVESCRHDDYIARARAGEQARAAGHRVVMIPSCEPRLDGRRTGRSDEDIALRKLAGRLFDHAVKRGAIPRVPKVCAHDERAGREPSEKYKAAIEARVKAMREITIAVGLRLQATEGCKQ